MSKLLKLTRGRMKTTNKVRALGNTVEAFGGLDFVVNNADYPIYGSLQEQPRSSEEAILARQKVS